MDAEVYGSSLLGPKIGNGFWQNLNGNFSPLTIDLWMRRTWGRLTGKSIGNEEALPGQRARLKEAVSRSRSKDRGNAEVISGVRARIDELNGWLKTLGPKDFATKKELTEEVKLLKAELSSMEEVLPDLVGIKAPEKWQAEYGRSNDSLLAYAKRLLAVWNVEYDRLRKIHDKAALAALQPTWARAAKTIVTNLANPLDQVANGTQRRQIEAAGARALEMLSSRGVSLTTADLQAVLWYPEKELWGSLTSELQLDEDGNPIVPPSSLNESYDTTFARILRSQGYEVEDATGRSGSGAVAGSDAGPVQPGGAVGFRQAGRDGDGAAGQGRGGKAPGILELFQNVIATNPISGKPIGLLYDTVPAGQEPQKTRKAFKLMKVMKTRPGIVFPLFARPEEGGAQGYTSGEWYLAENQRPQIGGKPLAERPGIHAVGLPVFDQGKATVKGETRVWVEVEMPAVDPAVQAESDNSPLLPNGSRSGVTTRLMPPGESYDYKTNPNASEDAGGWPIAGSVKLLRIVGDEEVAQMLRDNGLDRQVNNSMTGVSNDAAGRMSSDMERVAGAAASSVQEYEQKSRGSIIFGKDGIIIRLGADKDFSTFLHESGHLFLEQLRQDSAMSPKLKKDWDTVVEWWAKNTPSLKAEAIRMAASRNDEEAVTALGMMTDDEVTAYIRTGAPGAGRLGASESAQGYIGIAMHEQWARGVEDYFRTGRAPSIALQDAFNSFKAWIKRIYAGAMKAQLDVEFSPEVKGVMDRMIASDEDIAEVEYATNMQALFSDAESIGMTKETFKAYTESVRRAADESRARQLAKHIREENRIRMEWWKQEEEKVRGQIEEDVHARQEYVALYAITKGTLPDGAILDLPPGQMDRAEVVRLLGSEAALKGLAKNGGKVVYKKGGANPDVVAQSLGYADATALLEALGAVRPMAEVIAEETEARMKEIHGDMLTDKNFAAENALKSTYHDLQGSVLIAELNALRKSTDMLKPAFVRQWAKDKLGKEVISRLQPRIFQAAERKHRKEAAKQFKLANAAEAARSKFRELMNFYMAKESINAKDEIDKGRDYLAKFLSPKKKWGGVDAAYIDKIRIILESVDLGPRLTNRQRTIEELKAINEWIAREREDEGAILNIPERILRADTLKNYQNMTLDEFRELVDTVKMIETQGRKKKSLMIKGELVDREEKQKEILAGMADLPVLGRILRESGGVKKFWKFDKLRHAAASFDAALTKLSALAEVIDGTVRGPFWRYVVEPFSMAAAQESEIKREIVKPIIDLFAAMPSDQKKAMNDSVRVPSMGRSFTRSELIMIALNVGSQSNYDKMKDGSLKDDYAGAAVFTDQGISDAVNLLTDQELDIVEQVWRSFENTYPRIEEIYRRENGVAPARVEARTFTTASGRVLTGGYFPMMYDSARSSGGKMAEAKSALEAMQSAEVKASVFSGMTKGRTGFSAPVLLDIGRLPSQFSRVAHFISHYEAVRSSRLLVKGPVRKEIINKVGPEYADLIDNMLGYIANNGVTSTDGMDRLAGAMKSNVTASILAYSTSTVFMQFLGITSAITGIAKNSDGTQSMSKASLQLSAAMARYLSKPKETRRFVMERSAMMKNRIDSAETMLSDIAADLEGESSKISKMRAAGFKMIAGAQFYAVDLPTWMAAYDKALQTMGEGEAALHADYIVETTQTGGGLKDKSMFQTKSGLWQMLQFFYAPMNVLYNMLIGGAPTVRPIDKDVVGRWAARYLVAIVVMTAMETAMKGWEDEDDDGDEDLADFAKSVAVKSALFPFALIPGVREIASGVAGDFGYSISPMASIGENTVKSYRSISSDIDSGEFSKASLKALASTLGGVAGLPSVQFNRLVELINAFYEEKEVGPRDFLFGYKDKE
jgi:hypothetical protein